MFKWNRNFALTALVAVSLISLNYIVFAAQPEKESAAPAVEVPSTQPAPLAVFSHTQFGFGSVMEGEDVKHDFIIENRGQGELIIQNVRPD